MPSPVEITLSVTLDDPALMANLRIVNTTDKPVYLDKWSIGMDTTKAGNVFHILCLDDLPVRYTGIRLKRKFSPADFIRLDPGRVLTTAIRLDESYALPVQPATCTIRFSAVNHRFEDQDMFEMTSSPVTIRYPVLP